MNTPIKHEDIRKGDRIRSTFTEEFTATSDTTASESGFTYELIERPVRLPTEPGHYVDNRGVVWKLEDGHWECGGGWLGAEAMEKFAPLTRVRPVAEVAAEVLAEVRAAYFTDDTTYRGRFGALNAKWATK